MCPENEVYDECNGHCSKNCKTPEGGACVTWCKAGCRCTGEFARRDDQKCVKISECPGYVSMFLSTIITKQ